MIVAIDTSGSMSGLALMTEDGTLLAEQSWYSDRRHSEQVLAQLDGLCRVIDVPPTHIRRIVVAIGPGSWSGIRVGISVAKGIAIANDALIVGVSALDVLAWPVRNRAPITACISLGRGRFAVASYPHHTWEINSISPINRTVTDMTIDAQQLLVYDPHTTPLLPASMTMHRLHYCDWPHPRILAELGLHVFHTHQNGHPSIEPIYLGEPIQPKI